MIDLPTPHTRPLSHHCRRLDTAWTDGRYIDPHLNLMAHIIIRAWRDCLSGSPGQAEDARIYLAGANFRNDCEWLGIDPALILKHLDAMAQQRLNDDTIRAAHARYTADDLSLKDLSAELNVSPMTLSRAFGRLGLPARRPGTTVSLLRAKRPVSGLDELTRLIGELEDRARAGGLSVTIQVTLE